MRMIHFKKAMLSAIVLLGVPVLLQAQSTADLIKAGLAYYDSIQYFNYYDQRGLNTFETPKVQGATFNGFRVRVGAGFTQQFQNIKHENPLALNNTTTNRLYPVASGFMTSQANLMTDFQLADGIRLNLTTYLSARHHNEAWVKGGYIQFDKLPFKGKFWSDLMEIATIKIGHMEINYGDAHFRRPDGGHTALSPFMEGNIMDAFTTEIGGEVYLRKGALIGMMGMTGGMIKGHVDVVNPETVGDRNAARNPSVYFKGGVDKTFAPKVRVRVTGSLYTNSSSAGSGLTLFAGDRTGSNYQNIMEKAPAGVALPAYTAMYSSGRFNPGMNKRLTAAVLNGFVKVQGFEAFGTLENVSGYGKAETVKRTVNQFALEGLYRFGSTENLYIGAKYNTVNGKLAGIADDVKVQRTALAAGWFITRNVLLKGELVNQKYLDFPTSDFRAGGKFNGYVIEAVVGF